MDPKQAKCYRDMAKMAEASVDGGRVTAEGVLAEITRLRQFADAYGQLGHDREMIPAWPSAKIDWIIQFLRELEGTDRKVVVASSFTKMVELIATAIEDERDVSGRVLTLTGATTDKARVRLVEQFQDPDSEVRVAVINSRAGGEAITLDRADDLVFVDMPWTGDEAEQVEARIHRVSRIHQVTVHRLASVGTIDEWMAGMNDEQRALLRSAKPEALKLLKEAVSA
jgi:SNF2 family DNA or RNA helicase